VFKTPITSTPFTTDAANGYFQNIRGQAYQGDYSFLATLRAFMGQRIPENESIELRFSTSNITEDHVKNNSADAIIRAICGSWDVTSHGYLQIHNLGSPISANNLACYHCLHSYFAATYHGWRQIEEITNLFRKNFNVLCYINAEQKSTILFVESLNMKRMHFLQSITLGILPWYFSPDKGWSDLDKELMQSFKETTPDKYIECINKIASQYDFETIRIKTLLRGFETRYERNEVQKVEREIANLYENIAILNTDIGTKMRMINEKNIRLLGLQAKIAGYSDEDSELMEYFLCNRQLVIEDVVNDTIYFSVKTYMEYFDEDVVNKYLNNHGSFVYQNEPRGFTLDQMEKLLRAVFIDQSIRLRFCAAYCFSLNGNVDPQTNHDFGQEFRHYMPNPHINRWHCMGNYLSKVNNLLKENNYIAALEQCVASAKSLNWTDGTVMGTFLKTVCGRENYNNKAFELPDGRVVTPIEAIKWLEEQEKASTTTENTESEAADE